MNLDEEAINAVKEYFESITQSAIDIVYESVDSDTTFSEFMEGVNQKVNQFASELVASEVLNLSAKSIENFNSGAGMEVDDVQELIENDGELDSDEDDEDDGIRF
jgi:hypothetical protein